LNIVVSASCEGVEARVDPRFVRAAGIWVHAGATGSMGEAIAAPEQGRLAATEAADVEGQWG
jgi:hypothetical protein